MGEFSGDLVVRIPGFHCYGLGSISGQGTETPQAMGELLPIKKKKDNLGGWRKEEHIDHTTVTSCILLVHGRERRLERTRMGTQDPESFKTSGKSHKAAVKPL